MQLKTAALKTHFTWGTFIRSTTIRHRKHPVDELKKLVFQGQDLGRSLMNEKNAHQLPPPVNPQTRPQRAAVKNEIGISERLSKDCFSVVHFLKKRVRKDPRELARAVNKVSC